MTVLPQGERELLEAHERLNRRRTRLLVGPPSGISGRGHTSWPSERGPHGRRAENRRRVPRITPGMVALVASVAVVFGVAAVFLLGVRKPHAPAHASLSGAGQHVGENGIDQTLIRNFRILRRPVRPSDRLPPALAQIATLRAPLNGGSRPTSLDLTPDLAREVTLPGTGLRAWLIPGRHGLCWDAEYAGHELGSVLQLTPRLGDGSRRYQRERLGQDENRATHDRAGDRPRPRARADETSRTANPSSHQRRLLRRLWDIREDPHRHHSQRLSDSSSRIQRARLRRRRVSRRHRARTASTRNASRPNQPAFTRWRSYTRGDRADLQIDPRRLTLAHTLRGQTHRCTQRVRGLALQHPPRRAATRLHHFTPRARRDTDDERGPTVGRRAVPPDSRHARDSGARKDPG